MKNIRFVFLLLFYGVTCRGMHSQPLCPAPDQRNSAFKRIFHIKSSQEKQKLAEQKMLEYARKGDFKNVITCIERKKEDILAIDEQGWDVLHWAIAHGNYAMVSYCLNHKNAHFFFCGVDRSLFHAVMCCGFPKKLPTMMVIIDRLIERGASINYQDIQDRTVLFWAFYYKNLELVKYLVEHGALILSYGTDLKELDNYNFPKGSWYLYYVSEFKKNNIIAKHVCASDCMPWYMPLYFLKIKDGNETTHLLDYEQPNSKEFNKEVCTREVYELFEAQPQECIQKYHECRALAQRLKKYQLDEIFVKCVKKYKQQNMGWHIRHNPKLKKDLVVHFK